jgi:hypothetical protein
MLGLHKLANAEKIKTTYLVLDFFREKQDLEKVLHC